MANKLVSVKQEDKMTLDGVFIETHWEDKTLRSIRLVSVNGQEMTIKPGPSYTDSLRILVPEPPEPVDRWVLSGDFMGITKVSEVYTDEKEARDRLAVFREKGGEEGSFLSLNKVSGFVGPDGWKPAGTVALVADLNGVCF